MLIPPLLKDWACGRNSDYSGLVSTTISSTVGDEPVRNPVDVALEI
jgi:hypothetical protein